MANRVIEWWDEHGYPEEPVHIEGIRAIEELYVFEVVFGYIPVIFVDADPDIRLQRLQQRGRDGEDRFGKVDLIERDIREAEWGLRKLEHLSDHPVENDLDYGALKNRIGMKLIVLGYDLQ
ncbi:Dephospho-CoA kinase [Halapricum desulfuricans]|uniref:Dephospho-CoA kinase n=2 Tax=Halapricum desulfuricans TaxID=2841257 RepID=A0A897N5S8_9EURY|nr:Dephospho-CoA kinase [Halapricum desulfuricans]